IICFILLTFHWSFFIAIVVFLVWRGNVKRKRQYESHVKARTEYVNEHSEEFEVIGVTEPNEDGKNRQDVFIRCYRGDTITFKFRPTEDRPNVVEVWTKFGMIGYLAPYDVGRHIEFFQSTEIPTGEIKKLTGGTAQKPELGCMVSVYITPSETHSVST